MKKPGVQNPICVQATMKSMKESWLENNITIKYQITIFNEKYCSILKKKKRREFVCTSFLLLKKDHGEVKMNHTK